MTRSIIARLAGAACLVALAAAPASAEPVKLTIGYGPASDVTLLLIKLKPDIAKNYGKAYTLDLQEFRGSDQRFKAFLAGALDGATASANSVIDAASKGIELKMVASISKESTKGFSTAYMVLADSPIRTPADMKGKVIGINGQRSSIELWARKAVQNAGLNPDRDVKFTVVEFPLQGQALRSKQIDVGAFPQPYAQIEEEKGGVRVVFTAQTAVGFDQETQVLFFGDAALKKNPDAVRGFLADAVAATHFYVEHSDEARRLILKSNAVRMAEAQYLSMKDYYRDPDMKLDLDSLDKMQTMQIAAGYQQQAVPIKSIVDQSFLPK